MELNNKNYLVITQEGNILLNSTFSGCSEFISKQCYTKIEEVQNDVFERYYTKSDDKLCFIMPFHAVRSFKTSNKVYFVMKGNGDVLLKGSLTDCMAFIDACRENGIDKSMNFSISSCIDNEQK